MLKHVVICKFEDPAQVVGPLVTGRSVVDREA